MCVTVPRQVLQVEAGRIEILYDSVPRWLPVHGLPDLAVGEYVTVYAGAVLDRMPAADAEDLLRFFAELVALEDAAYD